MNVSRTVWVRLVQATLSVSLLYYLIQLVDWDSVSKLLKSGIVFDLWPGPVILLIGLGLAAERWRIILKFFRVNIGLFEALYLYLSSTFYGVALPGVLGGDIVRIAMCRSRTGADTSRILASVTIERGLGLWGVAIIGTIGSLTISSVLPHELDNYLQLISPAVAMGLPFGLLMALVGTSYLSRLRFLPEYAAKLGAIFQQIVTLAKSVPFALALTTLLLSTAFQASEIFIFYYFGYLLHIDVPFAFYLFVVPLIYLSTVLPISLGGVGVREGVLVWVFAMIGIPSTDAVLLALLVYLNRIVVAGVGGCVHFTMVVLKDSVTFPSTNKET